MVMIFRPRPRSHGLNALLTLTDLQGPQRCSTKGGESKTTRSAYLKAIYQCAITTPEGCNVAVGGVGHGDGDGGEAALGHVGASAVPHSNHLHRTVQGGQQGLIVPVPCEPCTSEPGC